MRLLVAKMKLIPNKAMLDGKRVLFCDDSIVRGTQLRDNVGILYDCGCKEVHMRIACPPLIYSCPLSVLLRQRVHWNSLPAALLKIWRETKTKTWKNMQQPTRLNISRWWKSSESGLI